MKLSGASCTVAVNGKEAAELFEQSATGTFDAILSDVQMPVMNGYEAATAIRRLAETGQRPDAATIPIIALTANAFADDAYRARQAGMNEHVAKPLEMDRLLGALHRWIS